MTEDVNESGTAMVFISHASEDTHLAQQVRSEFEEHGLLCWVDNTGIASGASEWWRKVEEAIDRATCVVVLWTPNSVGQDKEWVYTEAQRAHKQRKLQQLLVDQTNPPLPFGGIQGIRCSSTDGDIEREPLWRLINFVRGLINLKGPNERILQPRHFGEQWDCEDLSLRGPVPGTDIFVSFHPCSSSDVFSQVRAGTTEAGLTKLFVAHGSCMPPSRETLTRRLSAINTRRCDFFELRIRYSLLTIPCGLIAFRLAG